MLKIEIMNNEYFLLKNIMDRQVLPCRALPCKQVLPCRALPCRALLLIKEYSKPLTNPRWRKWKPIMTTYQIYLYTRPCHINLLRKIKFKYLCKIIFLNIMQTDWHRLYIDITRIGINNAAIQYNIPIKKIIQTHGFNEANTYCKE
jgi:hypothetical protein